MTEYLQSLPDGWTIYVWLVAAAMILIVAGYFMWWAAKNEQFDEDIKYVIFDEKDKNKMSPEDFAKSQEVMKQQMQRREENLAKKNK
ncbi:MAG: hypothetical protein M3A44_03305 [Gammaproteobacteria bacterium]